MYEHLKASKENQNSTNNNKKVNLIYNIPNSKSRKNMNTKLIKNNRAINYFNIKNCSNKYNSKTISSQENITSIKNITNYITINKSLLLEAYEKSLLILFNSIKSYMKNDIKFFNKLKDSFIKNVQNYYQNNKSKLSIILPKSKNTTTKIESKPKSNSKMALHKNNNFNIYQTSNNLISYLSNYSMNRLHTSIQTPGYHSKKRINELPEKKINSITSKKSLYLLKKAKNPLNNNNKINDIIKKDYKLSLLKRYFENNKGLRKNNEEKYKGSFNRNNNYSHKHENEKNIKNTNKGRNNNINIMGNKAFNINNINKVNNNIYYNKTINKIDKNNNNEFDVKIQKNNDLITCIKNSLDDNLKGIFDFSYETFLNKESEREGY